MDERIQSPDLLPESPFEAAPDPAVPDIVVRDGRWTAVRYGLQVLGITWLCACLMALAAAVLVFLIVGWTEQVRRLPPLWEGDALTIIVALAGGFAIVTALGSFLGYVYLIAAPVDSVRLVAIFAIVLFMSAVCGSLYLVLASWDRRAHLQMVACAVFIFASGMGHLLVGGLVHWLIAKELGDIGLGRSFVGLALGMPGVIIATRIVSAVVLVSRPTRTPADVLVPAWIELAGIFFVAAWYLKLNRRLQRLLG